MCQGFEKKRQISERGQGSEGLSSMIIVSPSQKAEFMPCPHCQSANVNPYQKKTGLGYRSF